MCYYGVKYNYNSAKGANDKISKRYGYEIMKAYIYAHLVKPFPRL